MSRIWVKEIDGIRNYFIKEIKQKHLMSKKHKKVSMTLNYMEHLTILLSTITGYDSISSFASLVGIPKYYKFCSRIEKTFH